jgi:hypothetical protein
MIMESMNAVTHGNLKMELELHYRCMAYVQLAVKEDMGILRYCLPIKRNNRLRFC